MQFIFPGRAEWRALTGAALIGSGAGLGLGALYLSGELNHRAAEYARVEAVAEAAMAAYDAPEAAAPLAVTATTPATKKAAKLAKKDARTRELTCLTDAVYYEARSEDVTGQRAVAQVVLNRVKHPAYPKSICGVVFQGAGRRGCQFSFACDGSMRARREDAAWTRARRVATRALAGAVAGEVGSATHYHNLGVSPAWSSEMRRVAQIGAHVFYRFSPRKAAAARAAAEGDVQAEQAVFTSAPLRAAELRVTPAIVETPAPAASPETAAAPSAPAPDTSAKPAAAIVAGAS